MSVVSLLYVRPELFDFSPAVPRDWELDLRSTRRLAAAVPVESPETRITHGFRPQSCPVAHAHGLTPRHRKERWVQVCAEQCLDQQHASSLFTVFQALRVAQGEARAREPEATANALQLLVFTLCCEYGRTRSVTVSTDGFPSPKSKPRNPGHPGNLKSTFVHEVLEDLVRLVCCGGRLAVVHLSELSALSPVIGVFCGDGPSDVPSVAAPLFNSGALCPVSSFSGWLKDKLQESSERLCWRCGELRGVGLGTVHLSDTTGSTRLMQGQGSMCLSGCSDCAIYSPHVHNGRVVISNCSGCTIVVGPCTRAAIIKDCHEVKISVVARTVIVKNCSDSSIFMCTPFAPIFNGTNKNIHIAPFNAEYEGLGRQLSETGLPTTAQCNAWDDALVVDPRSAPSVLEPDDFFAVTVPFHFEGEAPASGCALPERYAEVCSKRAGSVEALRQQISRLPAENREAVREAIKSQFLAWLYDTGCMREIDDLIVLGTSK
eukprot:m51a1_g3695 putative tbcc domain-containing protein 1 (489) ;mRNA; f:377531-379514